MRGAESSLRRDGPVDRAGATLDAVPSLLRASRHVLLRPAARKALRQRMVRTRPASIDRIGQLTGAAPAALHEFRREVQEGELPELLLRRGAGPAFAQEMPQGALLYVLVRALKPHRVVETGVRPGYSTAWLLGALARNGTGELLSIGPGSGMGRTPGVHEVTVGQFVAPSLRARWSLLLGNSKDQLRSAAAGRPSIDLFFSDNGPDYHRAQYELRTAWAALSPRGILLAHRVDANPAWSEFCRQQGLAPQLLDPGPPPLGALAIAGRVLR